MILIITIIILTYRQWFAVDQGVAFSNGPLPFFRLKLQRWPISRPIAGREFHQFGHFFHYNKNNIPPALIHVCNEFMILP